ncbi:asparagine synthase (glutamine-hydrolyzing) [Desulfobaculum bizertense]|uniref:asparagine synthase (glutamine-hydrolyzing) n=1 Tax=Desulfobaculum bizertense DSM 18034 TaxID=1121442 RepID=A0A1T4WRZ8_9BACT|nr:asparagine synthase (glutamine-hydrolyzing) [Desulfobaculum bizertense]UIJ37311.1 asparagine synthase (glutamine-hydrolyzing) [Desulfobaculum bizertense]SKA79625.1 asparagine synthase (glutamine-hydrolysing) [Desulfobaculum bizertense DSM 18034]
MCGIAGCVQHSGIPNELALRNMVHKLAHRGPDAHGLKLFPASDSAPAVALGHRRLSIVDLSSRGAQPMCNETGRIWLTTNGEIYNYRELRYKLEQLGHEFHSDSDSEVILHAYEEWGRDCVNRFKGMFAFAIWNQDTNQLFIARDRWGKKPLHYYLHNGLFLFASELGALLEHPAISRELEPEALSRYLLHEYVPSPFSLIRHAAKLPPGHTLIYQHKHLDIRPYWEIPIPRKRTHAIELTEAQSHLTRTFRSAIQRRLMGDVPVGVFLSGGLDSSAITAHLADIIDPSEIHTFSIGFEEPEFDESSNARLVAQHLGTQHHEARFSAQSMLDILPQALDCLSEPLADPSFFPSYLLSAFARQDITVALGGDGGDELFYGYDPFLALGPAKLAGLIPSPLLRAMHKASFHLRAAPSRPMSFPFRLQHFLKGLTYKGAARQQAWLAAFTPLVQKKLLHPDLLHELKGFDPLRYVDLVCSSRHFSSEYELAAYFYLRFYMVGHILQKVDLASMAHGLEVRCPFLDHYFSARVCSLPPSFKLRRGVRKYLLRRMLAGKVPAQILDQPKKGFGIPLAQWLRGPLKPLLLDTLSEQQLRSDGIFNYSTVQSLISQHLSAQRDNRKELWTLLCFQLWKNKYL